VAPERLELLVPVRLELVEPGRERGDRLRAEPEHPGPRVGGGPLVGDQAGLEQHTQMAAHCRGGHPGRRGQLAGPPRALAEKLDHLPAGGVGQRGKQFADAWFLAHADNI
jgi:hypothetical protein